jgi:chlorobactene glucosyltransferase
MESLTPFILAAPWGLFGLWVLASLRLPRRVEPVPTGPTTPPTPSVSVIVPARNEARNIEACVGSLARSDFADFEIIVVDDRSDDGTGEMVRALGRENARAIRVLEGAELPDGWLGKPWACHQGAEVATGDVLLFTDADTTHAPDLLARAIASLEADGTEGVSLVGRQLMETFWERLVQPQIFFLLALRYPRLDRVLTRERAGQAIANGQYILVRRSAYDEIGGHGAVRGEVVEDLRFAQVLCAAGHSLSIREAEAQFATRMYTSRAELREGWGKNLYMGALQSAAGVSGLFRALALPGIIGFLLGVWVLPALGLVAAVLGIGGGSMAIWAGHTAGFSLLFWVAGYLRFGAPVWYAALYPLGAAEAALIVLGSWRRGGRVRWKGREYRVSS